ncbi:MAG: arsenate reductase (glutaredoxin) [Verrucomicrobia bacterium]|nr:arsenate reductase (glutaredoxin) [Verrucomicrobiota bacterium]MDA1087198.1 arsenate reductase (glutaredoxin) [Verrucomicrobiota bacterium]
MARVTIYHNPRCAKSRATLALIRKKGIEPEVVEYLETPLDVLSLRKVVNTLGIPVAAIVRTKEYKELNLPQTSDESTMLELICKHPQIMQRPIVVNGKNACIGRPPENVLDII